MNGDPERGESTAKLWLFLLKSGGRWSSGDAEKAAGVEGACWLLAAMARSVNVRRYPLEGKAGRFTYGVTGACKIPRCVNVQQVAECVMAQAPDREEVVS